MISLLLSYSVGSWHQISWIKERLGKYKDKRGKNKTVLEPKSTDNAWGWPQN